MELHQLEYVRAVVRTGSVTRAAEEAHVAQPSVSKQIKLLERELGVPLFHRVGRRVVPTEAGILLAECAGRVLDDLSATTAALAEFGTSSRGSLRLCATETVTDNLLPPALARLRVLRPGVHITVEMLGTDDAVAQVLRDEVDLAIVVLPLADSRLDIHLLCDEEILLAAPRDHPWAGRAEVAVAEALAEPNLLLSMPGHGLRAQIEREAQAHGIRLEGRLDLRSQRALLNMVACGAGVAFAPLMSVRDMQGQVAALPLVPRLTRSLGWVVRRGRRVPPVATLLIGLMQSGVDDGADVVDES